MTISFAKFVLSRGYSTIAVKTQETLLYCYIFQGPSYVALQKLEQFIAHIQASKDIWQILRQTIQTDIPHKAVVAPGTEAETNLDQLITDIFLSSSHNMKC